jgi:prevent-host-death family protein
VKTLTVSKAAKNLENCVKRVYREHESFELVKNGTPYAHLVPANGKGCTTHEFADDISPLRTEDRRAFAAAIRKGRKSLKPLKNPWA